MSDVALMPKFPPESLGVGVRVHVCRKDKIFGVTGKPLEFDAIIEKTSVTQGIARYGLIVIDEHDNPRSYHAWFDADELTVTDSDRNRGCWIIDKYQQKG